MFTTISNLAVCSRRDRSFARPGETDVVREASPPRHPPRDKRVVDAEETTCGDTEEGSVHRY